MVQLITVNSKGQTVGIYLPTVQFALFVARLVDNFVIKDLGGQVVA